MAKARLDVPTNFKTLGDITPRDVKFRVPSTCFVCGEHTRRENVLSFPLVYCVHKEVWTGSTRRGHYKLQRARNAPV